MYGSFFLCIFADSSCPTCPSPKVGLCVQVSIRSGDSISLDQVRVYLLVGSLSNNDGHGYENVPQKVKSCCIKLYRAYSTSFNSSNVGNLFWSWNFWKTVSKCRKGERKSLCLRSPQNVKSDSAFSRRSRAVTAKKCTIKRDARADCCCFANLNLLLFLPFSLTSPSSLLKLPSGCNGGGSRL